MALDAASSPGIDHVAIFPRAEQRGPRGNPSRWLWAADSCLRWSAGRHRTATGAGRAARILDGAAPPADAVLIVVTAPGRTAIVAQLFQRLGAVSVHMAARGGDDKPDSAVPAAMQPDIRIGDAGMASET